MTHPLLRYTAKGAVMGFALGLALSLARLCRPETALKQASMAALALALAGLIAAAMNQRPDFVAKDEGEQDG